MSKADMVEYRELAKGEQIQEGDEWFMAWANQWKLTMFSGSFVLMGELAKGPSRYRRKVPRQSEP